MGNVQVRLSQWHAWASDRLWLYILVSYSQMTSACCFTATLCLGSIFGMPSMKKLLTAIKYGTATIKKTLLRLMSTEGQQVSVTFSLWRTKMVQNRARANLIWRGRCSVWRSLWSCSWSQPCPSVSSRSSCVRVAVHQIVIQQLPTESAEMRPLQHLKVWNHSSRTLSTIAS